MTTYSIQDILRAIVNASKNLSARKEEINRLNVFPVPDGDTGTNMSLTIESVVKNLQSLQSDCTAADIKHSITTGALMGARGNSGVITSQILRGFCEGASDNFQLTTDSLSEAFEKAVEVSFQAVRKPVEGTILTVLKDSALAAKTAAKKRVSIEEALEYVAEEAYASVQRTPELLEVLKENNVVDAGAFGLAILIDGFASSLLGGDDVKADQFNFSPKTNEEKVEIEHNNDWEGSQYRYCNEFLVYSETLDKAKALDFLSTMGDCELCVGEVPRFKVHVHSNNPHKVLEYFVARGQIFEVFIHNMDLQSAERNEKLLDEHSDSQKQEKEIGIVAVAPGEGNARILESLGVDVVVSGGQTMNPSTADLLDAVKSAHANNVIILPNNSNIIMAANSCASIVDFPCKVIPTKTVPQAFAALFGYDPEASLDDNFNEMSSILDEVKTGEITVAVKDSRDAFGNPIKEGDTIGIADGAIKAVGANLREVTLSLISQMDVDECDTITLLAGEDLDDSAFDDIAGEIESAYPDLEIEKHRGEQPLYPLIFSLE